MKLFRKSPFNFFIILLSSYILHLNLAFSHFGGRSYSTWKLKDQKVEGSLRIKAFLIRKMRFSNTSKTNLTESLNTYLEEKIVITKEDELCPLFKKPFSLPLQGGDIVVSFSFQCPKRLNDISKIKIYFNAFFPFSPQHLHFAEVNFLGKRENQYILFSKEKRAFSLQKNE